MMMVSERQFYTDTVVPVPLTFYVLSLSRFWSRSHFSVKFENIAPLISILDRGNTSSQTLAEGLGTGYWLQTVHVKFHLT